MKKLRTTIPFLSTMAIGFFCLILSSCGEKNKEGMIIFTRSQVKSNSVTYDKSDSWRYISQAQIMELNPERPETTVKVLTGNFYSAHSPQISYDGKYMLFAAQQKQDDPWQIWEMDLNDLKSRQVTSSKENCTDPAYLPLGRIVFSKYFANDTLKAGHSLYTCNTDGSNPKRITFNPHTYLASNVLSDGRVLTIGRQVFPEQGVPMFMVLRPDGSKAELFYKGAEGTNLNSPALEASNGKIVFIESEKSNPGEGNLISINYNRPLHSRVNLSSEIKGDFHFVFPLHSGKLLVSYRKSESERYALYEFDAEKKALSKAIYSNNDFDVLDIVVTGKHERPKKLPSEVDMGVKTGLLLCQDINILNMQPSTFSKSSEIKIVGIDSTLGYVNVAEDGSFYLKVMADKPFQIETVDKDGNVSRSSCGWIWLRPNERRGCVGCHEDPEIVPSNRVPLSVKKLPVKIPMHINKVVEKKVSLE
jgi:Hydrazine synthase alpha subunit middle domain